MFCELDVQNAVKGPSGSPLVSEVRSGVGRGAGDERCRASPPPRFHPPRPPRARTMRASSSKRSSTRSCANRKIKCKLCPRECTVGDKERGYCGVRENRGGTYYTLVHSRVCAAHVDPIEKKPLFHYLPGTIAFSMATAGCNVNCKFCQNWDISQSRPEQVPAAVRCRRSASPKSPSNMTAPPLPTPTASRSSSPNT